MFVRWHDAIDAGVLAPPLSLTPVDVHADLGFGEAGFGFVLTEVVHRPVSERLSLAEPVVTDGISWRSPVACRWLSD